MKKLGLREAKAALSAVVEAAERGEATTITKYGRPAAVVVPVDATQARTFRKRPSFAALLMSIPSTDFERDGTSVRNIDL